MNSLIGQNSPMDTLLKRPTRVSTRLTRVYCECSRLLWLFYLFDIPGHVME
ncbi:MAG: hypothetical protein R6T98_04835 [Desulfatiglandales bacterium]